MIQGALALCHLKGKFLYEALPDYFPQSQLTQIELQLWDRWLKKLKESSHG